MYVMNNLCMVWSLLEDMYRHIGYRNGLPPETAAAALHTTDVLVKRGKKRSAMNAKHLQLICILLLPLLITLKCTLNIFATAVTMYGQYIQMKGVRYIL